MFHRIGVPKPRLLGRMRGCCAPLIGCLSVTLCPPADARTWTVWPDGTGDAPTIQAAVDSAQALDDVLLEPGTYTWSSQGMQPNMIQLKDGVWLHGRAGAAATILDAENQGRIIRCENVGNQTRIEGLTLTGGNSRNTNEAPAGAILVLGKSGSPAIAGCVFTANYAASRGTGGAIDSDTVDIQGCEFRDKLTEDGAGGAIRCFAGVIRDCVFEGNRARGDGAASGGAVFTLTASISHCLFKNNTVVDFLSANGGAVLSQSSVIESCVFVANRAISDREYARGGAIYMYDTGTITGCTFLGNAVEAVLLPALAEGGAVHMRNGGAMEHCTYIGNFAEKPEGVGGITANGIVNIHAVILSGTSRGLTCSGAPGPSWSCSNVSGNTGGDAICGTDDGTNFSEDPQFCAANPLSSLHVGIQSDSPCAPGRHPDRAMCGLIGAGPVSCDAVSIRATTWSHLKSLYRDPTGLPGQKP